MSAVLVSLLVLTSFGQVGLAQWRQLQCQGRIIPKRYFNYAEGFSVAIPNNLLGRAGQAAGPERGVSVPLSRDCTGVVVVYGEPNSLDWKMPVDAIKWKVKSAVEDDPQVEVWRYTTRLGKLKAAGVILRHNATSEVENIVIAFRPGGGPVYTAMLSTAGTPYKRDRVVFRKVLRGFRLEDWR